MLYHSAFIFACLGISADGGRLRRQQSSNAEDGADLVLSPSDESGLQTGPPATLHPLASLLIGESHTSGFSVNGIGGLSQSIARHTGERHAKPIAAALEEGTWEIESAGSDFLPTSTLRIQVAGKELFFESGGIARQASGGVTVNQGETNVFAAACFEKKPADAYSPTDFTPLRVDYFERLSAIGQTRGGFVKRERAGEGETLNARIIDRPIRPLIDKNWMAETQLTSYVLSNDEEVLPDVMALCAASAALSISEVPFPKPIACVRVGYVPASVVRNASADADESFDDELDARTDESSEDDDNADEAAVAEDADEDAEEDADEERVFIVNPTREQMKSSTLDLVLAGTETNVLMIEGFCDFLPEELLVEGIQEGLEKVSIICKAIKAWAKEIGAPDYTAALRTPLPGVDAKVADIVGDRIVESITGPKKSDRENWEPLVDEAVKILTDPELPDDERYDEVDVKSSFRALARETIRMMGVEGRRQDGRTTTEVRPIEVKMSPLPKQVHGSVLFTRGETQSLGTATLGDGRAAQRFENLEGGDQAKKFYLQYIFPPFSVGEVGFFRAPGRREVGHGNLAERAIKAAMPSEDDDFAYVARVESLITESCGSSSMASVCSGCLALMAAGVPIKRMVAGIAMGLLLDESGKGGEPIVLTDILGSEDALGTMDFKVAGDGEGVTAFQLDIKCEGLDIELMRKALNQAKEGRLHILKIMQDAYSEAFADGAKYPDSVPKMAKTTIDPAKKGLIIGRGGETIKKIVAETGIENLDLSDESGVVIVSGFDEAGIEAAIKRVEEINGKEDGPGRGMGGAPVAPHPPIAVGDIFEQIEVKTVVPFGVFVILHPGVDAFMHVSELSDDYVSSPDDLGLKPGDPIDVKVTRVDKEKGQYRAIPLEKLKSDGPWAGLGKKGSPAPPPPPPPPPIEVGDVFDKAEVTALVPFGAFVNLREGDDALVHISKMSAKRVNKIEDVKVDVGDVIAVEIISTDNGKLGAQPLTKLEVAGPAGGRSPPGSRTMRPKQF